MPKLERVYEGFTTCATEQQLHLFGSIEPALVLPLPLPHPPRFDYRPVAIGHWRLEAGIMTAFIKVGVHSVVRGSKDLWDSGGRGDEKPPVSLACLFHNAPLPSLHAHLVSQFSR